MSVTLIECQHVAPVALIGGAYLIIAIGWSGAAMNHLDIAPTYAGEMDNPSVLLLLLLLFVCFTHFEI